MTKGVLLHDKVSAHKYCVAQVKRVPFKELDHPPYSPNLANPQWLNTFIPEYDGASLGNKFWWLEIYCKLQQSKAISLFFFFWRYQKPFNQMGKVHQCECHLNWFYFKPQVVFFIRELENFLIAPHILAKRLWWQDKKREKARMSLCILREAKTEDQAYPMWNVDKCRVKVLLKQCTPKIQRRSHCVAFDHCIRLAGVCISSLWHYTITVSDLRNVSLLKHFVIHCTLPSIVFK